VVETLCGSDADGSNLLADCAGARTKQEVFMIFGNIGWKRCGLAVAVMCLSSAVAMLLTSYAAQNVNDSQSKEKSVQALDQLRGKYAAINSVHLVADAKVSIYGVNGTGTFEYWAEDKRYKIKSHTDKHLGFKTDVDVAYDGKRFHYFDRGSGILSYRKQDEITSQAALPNPLFLPVDYLSNDDDDCPLCALRLLDLKSQNVRWDNRARDLEVKSKRQDTKTGEIISDVEMPGGKSDKRSFKLRVRMSGPAEENVRPIQIERIASDGKVILSLTFDDFMQNSLVPHPRRISINAFDNEGNLALKLEYTVRTLEINQPIDRSTFTINFDEAEGVWDSDEKRFVKEKPPKTSD
jgi:hypothetical protein